MIAIRTATEDELEAVQTPDRRTPGSETRKEFLLESVKAGRCLAAIIDDIVAGLGLLEQTSYQQGFTGLLIAHTDYRRRGTATALIRHVESICLTDKLFTSTNESNIPARKIYEANGFIRSGYIENLDEGDPEIIYFKYLGNSKTAGVL